jgi:hypothetical protein
MRGTKNIIVKYLLKFEKNQTDKRILNANDMLNKMNKFERKIKATAQVTKLKIKLPQATLFLSEVPFKLAKDHFNSCA